MSGKWFYLDWKLWERHLSPVQEFTNDTGAESTLGNVLKGIVSFTRGQIGHLLEIQCIQYISQDIIQLG